MNMFEEEITVIAKTLQKRRKSTLESAGLIDNTALCQCYST